MNCLIQTKNLRKNPKVCMVICFDKLNKTITLLVTYHFNYSLFISLCSDPSFQGNHERVLTSFHPKNRQRLCGRKSET